MTSQHSAPDADTGDAASVTSIDFESPEFYTSEFEHTESAPDFAMADYALPDEPTGVERSAPADLAKRETGTYPKAPAPIEGSLDSAVVEELTRRLPTAELVKIIKGALECGRRNLPFTESDLLRAMTFGSSALPTRQPLRGDPLPADARQRAPRG
ncbi:MAG TPA: hypothetical protein VMG12_03610 [Polyangiaceae bacterium]|nr:hypothetical protein [Polyangiaceae bacterium]